MVSLITIASLCLLAFAVAVVVARRRIGVSGLDNITVSRQWLMQHQADDRS